MIGETISHYRILSKLGEGGMGAVYKALDERLGRPVAIKLLPRRAFHDPAQVERFLHEARAASALNHPNITTLYEFDEVQGEFFIAMEFVEGETVKERIQENPGGLAVEETLRIGIQAGDALARAHAKGIVHRDVKSSNIIVTSEGQVKVTDFGLAKLGGATTLTQSGVVMGTAPYMAPEQARGEAADHRADVYSLGVVLYEMLTGRLPFSGDADLAVLYAVVHEKAVPIRKLRPEVAPEIERIISRAMEKTPSGRYQTMEGLVEDLRAVAQALPAWMEVRSVRRAAGLFQRRWSLPAFLGLAALLVVLMKGSEFLRTGESLATGEDPGEAIAMYREVLAGDPNNTEALLGLCQALLTRDPEGARQYATRARSLDRENALVHKCEGDAFYYLSEYKMALEQFEVALMLWEGQKNKAGMAGALNGIAVAAYGLGDVQRAEEAYLGARGLWEDAGDRRGLAKTLSNLGNFYRARGRYGEAVDVLLRALELYRAANDRMGEAIALNNLGGVYRWTDQYREAEKYYNQVLALSGQLDDAMLQASAYANLAATWHVEGRYEEAYALYNRALKLSEEIESQARVAEMTHVLGGLLREWGRYPEAMGLTQQGLVLAGSLGAKAEEMGALIERGLIYLELGRWDEATTDLEASLRLARGLHRVEQEAVIQRWLGESARRQGREGEARERYQIAFGLAQQIGREREIKFAEVALVRLWSEGQPLEAGLQRCHAAVSWAQEAAVYLLEIVGHLCSAEAGLRLGQYEGGLKEVLEARRLAQEVRLWQLEFEAVVLLGKLYEAAGNAAAAVQPWTEALEIVEGIRSQLSSENREHFMDRPDIRWVYQRTRPVPLGSARQGARQRPATTGEG